MSLRNSTLLAPATTVWSLAAVLLLATGSPSLQAQDEALAPADQAAFDALVLGQRMLASLGVRPVPASTYHVDFVVAGRFEETTADGLKEGSYTYSNTGPDTAMVVFTYDGGDICTFDVTFDSRTSGTLSSPCIIEVAIITDEIDWRLEENPDYVPVTPPETGTVGTESFSIPNLGGQSTTSNGTETTTQEGYGRIRADVGSTTPSGIAIIGYRPGGVLVAEAGVPASELVREGRIFAEVNGPVNTGLAIANPNDAPATIDFYFTDTDGARFAEGAYVLDAGRQIADFLNETPFNGGDKLSGTFTFTSSLPIAVIALRGFTNRDGEFLMTTLPVAPLATPLTPFNTDTANTGPVYFPHFADGSGWATQVILVNPTVRTITGTVRFLEQGSATAPAAPKVLTLDDDRAGSSFEYSVPPNGSYRIVTSNPPGGVSVGSVRAIPDDGHRAPSGLVIFSYTAAGKTVLEAGVPALPSASAFRVYVESSGMPEQAGSIRTGVAITNAADAVNTVTLEVTGLEGTLAAPPDTLTLPPSGQVSRFIDEFFDSLPADFSGVLRVTSTAEVAVVGLRLRYNDRGEIKMTTTPPSIETGASTMADRYFAHIVDSRGVVHAVHPVQRDRRPDIVGNIEFYRYRGGTLGSAHHERRFGGFRVPGLARIQQPNSRQTPERRPSSKQEHPLARVFRIRHRQPALLARPLGQTLGKMFDVATSGVEIQDVQPQPGSPVVIDRREPCLPGLDRFRGNPVL